MSEVKSVLGHDLVAPGVRAAASRWLRAGRWTSRLMRRAAGTFAARLEEGLLPSQPPGLQVEARAAALRHPVIRDDLDLRRHTRPMRRPSTGRTSGQTPQEG
jgi:hypothetical protein